LFAEYARFTTVSRIFYLGDEGIHTVARSVPGSFELAGWEFILKISLRSGGLELNR